MEGHLLKRWVLSQGVWKSLKVFKQRGATISSVLQTVLLAALHRLEEERTKHRTTSKESSCSILNESGGKLESRRWH